MRADAVHAFTPARILAGALLGGWVILLFAGYWTASLRSSELMAREVIVPPRIEILPAETVGDGADAPERSPTTIMVHNDSTANAAYRLMAFAIDPPVRLMLASDEAVGDGSLGLSVQAGRAERVAVAPHGDIGSMSDIVIVLSWGPAVASGLEQLLDSRLQSAVERIPAPTDPGGKPLAVQLLEPLATASSAGVEDVLVSTRAETPSQVERLEGRADLDSFIAHVSIVDPNPRSFVLVPIVDGQPILSTPWMGVEVPARSRVAVRLPVPGAPVGEHALQLVAVMVPPDPEVLLRPDRGLLLSARLPLVLQAASP